mmetsp:Transcript_74040/g.205161  ORF Transcript_74040/g.205161 Transcript_74040/m.205161 type:complete len:211 (+) Transcript_74040:182-814(+)
MSDNNFNTGAWTDEEHNKYLAGYEKFGRDWKSLEAFVGTRSKQQINTHHRHFTLKTTGALPEPTRKRKQSSDDESEEAATPKKTPKKLKESSSKPKATPIKSPAPAKSRGAAAKATPNPTKSAAAKATPKKVDDILPPSKTSTPAKKQKKSSKPEKADPVAEETSAPIIEEAAPGKKSRALEFLRREEVQTVVAGVIGFVAVIVIKKLMG